MTEIDTSRGTPPTEPDESRVERPRVTSPLAIMSLGFGAAGLVLPVSGIAAIVFGVMAVRRIPRLGQQGRGLAFTGIGIGVVGILVTGVYVFMIWSMVAAVGQTSRLIKNSRQTKVRSMAVNFAQTNQGRYPAHMAELALLPGNRNAWLVMAQTETPANVGDFDLSDFDGGEEDAAALTAAIDATDTTTPFYALGDIWYARLIRPTYDGDVIFSWSVDDEIKDAFFLMDDGLLNVVNDPEEWAGLWAADREARPSHGLEAVEAPAVPTVFGGDTP